MEGLQDATRFTAFSLIDVPQPRGIHQFPPRPRDDHGRHLKLRFYMAVIFYLDSNGIHLAKPFGLHPPALG